MQEQLQSAFNDVWTWFSQPGRTLAHATGTPWEEQVSCIYSSYDGEVRCAVGVRLPTEWLELHGIDRVNRSGGVYGLITSFPEVSNIIGEEESDLYMLHVRMQAAHDRSDDVVEFLDELRLLATDYSLEVPEVSATPTRELVTV